MRHQHSGIVFVLQASSRFNATIFITLNYLVGWLVRI